MKRNITWRGFVLGCAGAALGCTASACWADNHTSPTNSVGPVTPPIAAPTKNLVTFKSGDLTLIGFLFKPDGPGPFPALIWNHGSERNPGLGAQFDSVASIFVPEGFVVFAPVRRGHGRSEGNYIGATTDRVRIASGEAEADRTAVHLLETEQLADQLAGLAYLKTQPFVDTTRVVVAGCSYGGIEALLGAEQKGAYRGAIAISPAALSWDQNAELRKRLVAGVSNIAIPVMLLQPAHDASLQPVKVLGDEFRRQGKPFSGKVYPAAGPEKEQKHCFGGASGMHVWASDAVQFARSAVTPEKR